MFSFGFHHEGEVETVAAPAAAAGAAKPAEEVPLGAGTRRFAQETVAVSDDVYILKCGMSGVEVAGALEDGSLRTSDLVAGEYEGGFKLWEGATDLARYLYQEVLGSKTGAELRKALGGERVIELGCGHGIPGLLALQAGAEVHFQDYNAEVLHEVTIPAVEANWSARRLRSSEATGPVTPAPARFFAGDWAKVGGLLEEQGLAGAYDLVLTSETIYSLDSIDSLLECIQKCLKPGGRAIVAAKTYYFGVGGGTTALSARLRRTPQLRVARSLLIDDPKSVQREIIEIELAG